MVKDSSSPLIASSSRKAHTPRAWVALAAALLTVVGYLSWEAVSSSRLPEDPLEAATQILSRTPLIDGHIDLPYLVRDFYANNASAFDLNKSILGHVDIPRLRKGKVGGFFWSAYVACADDLNLEDGNDFLTSSFRVRDTLEQIDISKILINKYSDTFYPAYSARDIREAWKLGKIASFIGIEGAHSLGASIQTLRTFYHLGVRYLTLTHTCHNPFGDSSWAKTKEYWGGLSPLGHALVHEMNRIGMLVDLSHVSDDTARQALKITKAPVIWSHSSSRAVYNHVRNVPDDILEMIGQGEGKVDAVVMINFAPFFVAEDGKAGVKTVANHVERVAKIAGKAHVGIGSDFDGIGSTPKDLEDVSKYPNLFAELITRGWTAQDLAGLASLNFIRVLEGAEAVAKRLQADGAEPAWDVYDKRADIGSRKGDEF